MNQLIKSNYFYDKKHDSLVIYIKKYNNLFAEEEYPGIYFIKNDKGKLASIEILDFSRRDLSALKKRIPLIGRHIRLPE